jgi:hypothetical protein
MVYQLRPPEHYSSCWKCSSWVFMKVLQEADFWDPAFVPPRLTDGLFTAIYKENFFQSCCKIWICGLGFSCVTCRWCFTTFSSCILRILEQSVSGTMDRKRWTNRVACSLLWFNFLTILSLETHKVQFLRYRSYWRPGHATLNMESIRNDSFDTCNIPASQAVTVQACSVKRGNSAWTLWAFESGGRSSETMLQNSYVRVILVSYIPV